MSNLMSERAQQALGSVTWGEKMINEPTKSITEELKEARAHLCNVLKRLPDEARYSSRELTTAIANIDLFLIQTRHELKGK